MRYLLLLALIPSLCTRGSAQISPDSTLTFTEVSVNAHELLTAATWKELAGSEKPGYLLTLSAEGNFDEDATSDSARKYRHLLGRWALDTAANTITLSVDAFMAEGLLSSRYRRGRDYYVIYEIIDVSHFELHLKDVKTGRARKFIAAEDVETEDQARKRLPQGKKPPVFSLPDFDGGA